jgi:hypothetical protein
MIVSAPSQLRSVTTRQRGHAKPCGAAPALCRPLLGIQGYNDTRTTDESPERVALIQQATLAYLRTALGLDDGAWPAARETLAAASDPLGRIDSK